MGRFTCALIMLCAVASFAADEDKKARLFVNDISGQGVTPAQASAFTDAVVASLSERGLFEVVSTRDVQTLLGAERQKQLVGVCDADESQCSKDITQLLNARFVVTGQLSRVGSAFQLTLQAVDSQAGKPLGRSTKFSGTFEDLRALVPWAAAEATGSPLPPPPSRVLPISLIAVGAATAFSGGVVAFFAFSKEQTLNEELCPGGVPADGRCSGQNLRDRSFYVAQDAALKDQKILALSLAGAGLVMAGVGVFLMPKSDTGTRVALVPTGNGVAFAGGF